MHIYAFGSSINVESATQIPKTTKCKKNQC